jgi:hypothetical protein
MDFFGAFSGSGSGAYRVSLLGEILLNVKGSDAFVLDDQDSHDHSLLTFRALLPSSIEDQFSCGRWRLRPRTLGYCIVSRIRRRTRKRRTRTATGVQPLCCPSSALV